MLRLSNRMRLVADKAFFVYVILVVLYQLADITVPFCFVSALIGFSRFSQALAIIGFILFFFSLFAFRDRFDKRYCLWLFLVVGALILSSIVLFEFGTVGNAEESGLIANAKAVIWQIDVLLVIFPYCASLSKESAMKMARVVFWCASALYIPCIIASLYQYGFSIGYDAVYGEAAGTRQGFQGGRLFGVMSGVFCMGLMTLLFSIASAYYAYKAESLPKRILLIVFCILYFIYAVLSGTRSVLVAFAVASLIVSCLFFYRRFSSKWRYPRLSVFFLSGFLTFCAVGMFMATGSVLELIPEHNAAIESEEDEVQEEAEDDGMTPELYASLSQEERDRYDFEKSYKEYLENKEESLKDLESVECVLYSPEQETTDEEMPIVAVYFGGELMLSWVSGSNPPCNTESLAYFDDVADARFGTLRDYTEEGTGILVERPDVAEGTEASNGRIGIWTSYLDVLTDSPKNMIFGLSPGYYMPVIYDRYHGTDLYIVDFIEQNYPNMIANGLIYDVHNGYLSILVQAGLLGLILIAIFFLRLGGDALRAYSCDEKENFELLLIIALVAVVMTAVFFDSDLFFRTTSTSVLFWMICGFAAGAAKRILASKDKAPDEMEGECKNVAEAEESMTQGEASGRVETLEVDTASEVELLPEAGVSFGAASGASL